MVSTQEVLLDKRVKKKSNPQLCHSRNRALASHIQSSIDAVWIDLSSDSEPGSSHGTIVCCREFSGSSHGTIVCCCEYSGFI